MGFTGYSEQPAPKKVTFLERVKAMFAKFFSK